MLYDIKNTLSMKTALIITQIVNTGNSSKVFSIFAWKDNVLLH